MSGPVKVNSTAFINQLFSKDSAAEEAMHVYLVTPLSVNPRKFHHHFFSAT